MIQNFRSSKLRRFWAKAEVKAIDPKHVARIRLQLGTLDRAKMPKAMDVAGWRFHKLRGELRWSVKVDENWRITFGWGENGPVDVDYEDYH